jgi:hypothetical protein
LKNYVLPSQKWLWGFLLLGLNLVFSFPSFGQRPLKSDYVVLGDTLLTQGVIRELPSENNTVIYFARSKKSEPQKYTVENVTEFRLSERVFFRKEIPQGDGRKTVFLERLPNAAPNAMVWRLNEQAASYYLETSEGMEVLEGSFREQLTEALNNPLLAPLLEITKLNDFSLVYLFRTANTIQKPRTFSRLFAITPYVGYSSQTVGLTIPDSNEDIQVTGSSPAFGVNGEVFLTFKRSLSLNVGAMWTQFDSQNSAQYQYNQTRFDSDVFLDFSLLQIPVTVKYYVDLKPNKWRLFGEAGYSYALPNYDKLGVYQAEIEGDVVVTTTKGFEMSDSFSGFTLGIGAERYLNKHRGLVLGIRQFKVIGDENEFVQGLTFQLGYKF